MASWNDYLIRGLPSSGGQFPQRKELNDLSDEEKFLYLEGLKRFQEVPISDPLSYYQIAGIHGLPYTTWPNVQGWNNGIPQVYDPNYRDPRTGNAMFGGFCTHSSVLFLSWHRPYLALFESALYKHVNDVADAIDSSSGNKATYHNLARNFRIPYWDWARKDVNHFPRIALSDSARDAFSRNFRPPTINGQQGRAMTDNPLFKFRFPQDSLSSLTTIGVWNGSRNVAQTYNTTTRYPVYRTQSTPGEVVPAFDEFFRDQSIQDPQTNTPWPIDRLPRGSRPQERNLSERVAYVLKAYQRYGPMSYNAADSSSPDTPSINRAEVWGSLEDIHNTVHGYAGGGGHMSGVPRSAYDPIFWLHHANIDRLFTIWQALHESNDSVTYVQSRPAPGFSFAQKNDALEDQNTNLWPFRRNATGSDLWWTSLSAKRTETFGYTYPETSGWQYPGTTTDRARLVRRIDSLYVSLAPAVNRSMRKIATAGEEILPQAALLKSLQNKKVDEEVFKSDRVVQRLLAETARVESGPSLPTSGGAAIASTQVTEPVVSSTTSSEPVAESAQTVQADQSITSTSTETVVETTAVDNEASPNAPVEVREAKPEEAADATVAELSDRVAQITLMRQVDKEAPDAEELHAQYTGTDKPYLRNLLDENNKYLEWLINVKAQKHAMGGQAVVHFFLGDPPPAELSKLWPYTPYHVGAFVPLGQQQDTACEKCQRDFEVNLQVTGQIPLTIALTERYLNGTIANLSVPIVEEYLRKNLRWRVVLNDGRIIEDQSTIDGLVVYVVSNEVTVSEDPDVLPVYADGVTVHPAATTRVDSESDGRGHGTGLTIVDYRAMQS